MAAKQGTVLFTDLGGLCNAWDASPSVRERIRKHERLILEVLPGKDPQAPLASVPKTMDNTRLNAEILSPLLKRMSTSPSNAVPCIEGLTDQVKQMHSVHGLMKNVGVHRDEAWSLRYLLGKVKTVLNKPCPPKVAKLNFRHERFQGQPVCTLCAHTAAQDAVMRNLLADFGVDVNEWWKSQDCGPGGCWCHG